MPRPSYVLLQNKDWDKVKKKSAKQDEPKPEDEYITNMMEKSQSWVKTWPNSVEGGARRLEEQRENWRKQQKALIKAYSEKSPKDNTSKKSRQLILSDRCYAKQLWGSRVPSKIIEEREAQIKFNNELKRKLLKIEKEQQKLNTLSALNIYEAIKEKQKRLAALEIVKQNKTIETEKIEMERKQKEEDIQCNKIDAEFTKNITDQATQHKLKIKRQQKQAIEEFNVEKKQKEKIKETRQLLDDALTEAYRKEKDRTKCKNDKINKKIVINTQNDASKSKQVFKTIEKVYSQKKKDYEDFVGKGVKIFEERQNADDQQEIEKFNQNKEKRLMIEKSLKTVSENIKEKPKYSDRSSINLKSTKVKQKGPKKLQTEYKFKEPQVSLLDGLKMREKEKSPRTKATHARFAEQAASVLQECKHKQFVKKIIDDYRTIHRVDTTLPIPDY